MTAPMYDVIVVGAGIEGSSTALHLSRRGVKVLMLEQFSLPHPRGSSHGSSRIIRMAYPEKYIGMMNYSMSEWKRLQEESGITLYKNYGYINIGEIDGPLQNDVKSLKENNCRYEVLTPENFQKRFPNLSYEENMGAVYDPQGGVLVADKCLGLFQKLFVQNGGVLKDEERVEAIHPGSTVSVVTKKETYTSKSIVVCCGPWTNKVLKLVDLELPLKPLKMSVCYWPEKVPGSHAAPNNIPFSDKRAATAAAPFRTFGLPSDAFSTFGMPSDEYPGHFKLLLHWGPDADPENRDATDSSWVLNLLKNYVRKYYPELVPEPSIVESCFYTMTPDKDFILDFHPRWNNIVIGAGFSGHGFKVSPAVGNVLADLALLEKPTYDVNPFSIGRFNKPPTSNL